MTERDLWLSVAAATYGDSRWSWRTRRNWVQDWTQQRGFSEAFYNGHGAVLRTEATLEGTEGLERAAGGAPVPSTQSSDGVIVTSRVGYDAFGNVVISAGPNEQCRSVSFDSDYAQLPETETVYVGAGGLMLPIGPELASCGSIPLQTTGVFDRGLQAIVQVRGPNGGMSRAEYDGFGRVSSRSRPTR